jgi:hypothetical protein
MMRFERQRSRSLTDTQLLTNTSLQHNKCDGEEEESHKVDESKHLRPNEGLTVIAGPCEAICMRKLTLRDQT